MPLFLGCVYLERSAKKIQQIDSNAPKNYGVLCATVGGLCATVGGLCATVVKSGEPARGA